MAVIERKIYLHIVYSVGHLPLTFSLKEQRQIPCHSLVLEEYAEKLLCIKFKPNVGVSDEAVLSAHLAKLKKQFKIVKHQVYGDVSEYRKIKR